MSCYVCEESIGVNEVHHVIPRSRGGVDGPTVDLCPTCHSAIHMVARAMIAGKSGDSYIQHLDHDARGRAMMLIKSIVLVEASKEDKRNPHPLLAVSLDCHAYMVALAMLQKDRGFTSREKLVNSILQQIALKYGLVDAPALKPVLMKLRDFKRLK